MSDDWSPAPGERVGVLSTHSYGRTRTVEMAVVDRVGKRDIVLDDGRRFRVADLAMPNTEAWASRRTVLVQSGAPVVAEVRKEQEHRQYLTKARAACEDFRYERNNVTAADTILALAPLTGLRSEIEALFGVEP